LSDTDFDGVGSAVAARKGDAEQGDFSGAHDVEAIEVFHKCSSIKLISVPTSQYR